MTGRNQVAATLRQLPADWPLLFGPIPGTRSGKVRCLLCGRTGYPGPTRDVIRFDGRLISKARPHPWQLSCIRGHRARCEVCDRPFIDGTALAFHQRCRSHHKCCLDHTTVPDWKNPFRTKQEEKVT